MPEVIVTHAQDGAARAQRVTEKLSALGYVVRQEPDIEAALGPHGRRRLAAAIDQAQCVIVLWSKEAQAAPSLLAAASRAKAKGKLAFARIDAAAAPIGLRPAASVDLSGWMGRDTRAWKALVASVGALSQPACGAVHAAPSATPVRAAAAQTPEPEKKKGGAGMAIAAVFALIAALGVGAYFAVAQGVLPLP